MPRLTDRYRKARRDEIAQAAVRVLAQHGPARTSIAQIVAESGLSAGAIYSHFSSKADLARYVAQTVLTWRMAALEAAAADGASRSPQQVLALLLETLVDEPAPLGVVLQFWSEATVDAELRATITAELTGLRRAFTRALLPWAQATSAGAAEELADRTAATLVAIGQGYLVNAGLVGWLAPGEYLDSLLVAFRPSS